MHGSVNRFGCCFHPRTVVRSRRLMRKIWRPTHVDLSILCGHYEGVDERVRLALHPEEISVGDYVLTGGELPALVLIDAAARLVPGVLGDPESIVEESFTDALLEYPHYTRPAEVRGMPVPEVFPRTSRSYSSVASEGSPAKHVSETAGSFTGSGLESRRSTIARRTYS